MHLSAICQQKLDHLVSFRYILLFVSHRDGPVSVYLLCSNWTHITWMITICRESCSQPVIWKNKFYLSESLDHLNFQGILDCSSALG